MSFVAVPGQLAALRPFRQTRQVRADLPEPLHWVPCCQDSVMRGAAYTRFPRTQVATTGPAASKSSSCGSAAAPCGKAMTARLAHLPGSRVPIRESRPKARAGPSVPSSSTVARPRAGKSRATCRISAKRLRSGEEARLSVPRATIAPAPCRGEFRFRRASPWAFLQCHKGPASTRPTGYGIIERWGKRGGGAIPIEGYMTVILVFTHCVQAIRNNVLIERVSATDKEFHFQNWFKARLDEIGHNYELGGRNAYPDFRMVASTDGYELKGLAYPGRDASFDSNSQVPAGLHNGRTIYYVFGRYPKVPDGNSYPVLDLVICHGSFLNADHEYVHENKSVRGFGSYGDILIRDRKMYVVPTPFRIVDGAAHQQTLILPADIAPGRGFASRRGPVPTRDGRACHRIFI